MRLCFKNFVDFFYIKISYFNYTSTQVDSISINRTSMIQELYVEIKNSFVTAHTYSNDYLSTAKRFSHIFPIHNHLYLAKWNVLKKISVDLYSSSVFLSINATIWYKMNTSNSFVPFYFEIFNYETPKKYWKLAYISIFDNILNNTYTEAYFFWHHILGSNHYWQILLFYVST